MADVLTPEQRSLCMSRIRAVNTKPERAVRVILRALGTHYRLHPKNLPGRPDIVISARRLVILVHGCFWHRHSCRWGRPIPATNPEFWLAKFARNKERDRIVRRQLRAQGWKVVTVWECETRKPEKLLRTVLGILLDHPRQR